MATVAVAHVREPTSSKWWWLLLITGILWILIGLFVLQAHYDSVALVGYLVAFWLIFAGVAEFVEVAVLDGWKWLHAIVGVLFLLGGFAALTSPFQTFMVLAALIGFFLVVTFYTLFLALTGQRDCGCLAHFTSVPGLCSRSTAPYLACWLYANPKAPGCRHPCRWRRP